MENKNSKIHYAWYILAACFLLNMTVHVMVMQIASLYMVPMAQDLGVPRTLLSLQSVVMSVGAVVTAPFWGKIYKQHNARNVLLLCTVMTALCTIGRSFMPNVWGILILAAVKGVFFTGNSVLPISILLTAWFRKKRGLAISIASLGISTGSVIFSPVVERIISTYGWRTSDQLIGALMLIVMVPCTLRIIGMPKTKGRLPYGMEDGAAAQAAGAPAQKQAALTGMTFAEAKKSPLLYLFLLAVFGMVFATGAALQIPAYLTDIGYGSAVAARVVAAYSAVAIAGKLILGSVIDKFGEKTGSAYICIVGILAFICFVLAKNRIFLYGIILFWGLGSGITSVLPTLLTSKIFGNRDYGPIYGIVLSVNRFGGVIGTVLVSLLFDLTGDYTIIWPACVASMVLALAAIMICLNRSGKASASSAE